MFGDMPIGIIEIPEDSLAECRVNDELSITDRAFTVKYSAYIKTPAKNPFSS